MNDNICFCVKSINISYRSISRIAQKIFAVKKPTNLCLNMSAGSMLAEVSRTTFLISLAIILSFSKFTRPSTVESLPEMKNLHEVTHSHRNHEVCYPSVFNRDEWYFGTSSSLRRYLKNCSSVLQRTNWFLSCQTGFTGEFLATCPMRKAFFSILNLAVGRKSVWLDLTWLSTTH